MPGHPNIQNKQAMQSLNSATNTKANRAGWVRVGGMRGREDTFTWTHRGPTTDVDDASDRLTSWTFVGGETVQN